VLDTIGAQAYRLALPKEYERIHDVFHVSLLEPYHQRSDDDPKASRMPVALAVEGQEEWEVEQIVDSRTRKGQKQYLVKWEGWPDNYNSWEPDEHLAHSQDMIHAYETRAKRRRVK
jgi:hypothetical protein